MNHSFRSINLQTAHHQSENILYLPYSFSVIGSFDNQYPAAFDFYTKLQVQFQLESEASARNHLVVIITRLDNLTQGEPDYDPNWWHTPQDIYWRAYTGWPHPLTLHLPSLSLSLPIPAHPHSDQWQGRFTIIPPLTWWYDPHHYSTLSMEIPRKLFTIWEDEFLPQCLIKSISTFCRLNPHYKYQFFTDAQARDFIINHESLRVQAAFDQLKPLAFKADLFRFVLLYHEGGIYFDAKVSCLVPLDAFLPRQGGLIVNDQPWMAILNSFIALPPHDPLARLVIDHIVQHVEERFYGNNGLEVTGPALVGRCLYYGLNLLQQQRYTHLYVDRAVSLMYYVGRSPVIAQHNAEYRRLISLPGPNKEYTRMWDQGIIYGEWPPLEKTIRFWHIGLLSLGGILLIFWIAMFAIWLQRRLKL